MATVAVINGTANLCTAQTGNGATTNVVDRGGVADIGSLATVGPASLRIITTVGATPTCTYLIEGSPNNVDWFAVPYATAAAPETVAVATFAITTATTTFIHLRPNHAWRYLRITFSSNTNVTNTVDLWTF